MSKGSDFFYSKSNAKSSLDYGPGLFYGSLDEAKKIDKTESEDDSREDFSSLSIDSSGVLHPLVYRVREEGDDIFSSPSSSPRFNRRDRMRIKRYRDTTTRHRPLRGPGSWSPDIGKYFVI